jgi:hypothetical protein
MKPHKHAELIKLWADGAEIQYQNENSLDWVTIRGSNPTWHGETKYRIKPEPKPDVESYLIDLKNGKYAEYHAVRCLQEGDLKLIRDGETGKLKSAEVLK